MRFKPLLASLLTVVLVVALFSGAELRPAEAAFPGENGRIAFVEAPSGPQNPEGDPEIFSANPDGTGVRQLTRDGVDEFGPAWSPDGERIAFAVLGFDEDADARPFTQLFVMDADGRNRKLLYDGPGAGTGPAWSPDGEKLAFANDQAFGDGEIFTVNTDGTELTALTEGAAPVYAPAWSPDGTKIAFSSERSGEFWQIYVMNADGTGQRNLSNSAADDYSPDWSPDGRRLTFTRGLAGPSHTDVFAMDTEDGSNQTNLTRTRTASESWPTWSPDGAKIAFEWGDASRAPDVRIMNADGTDPAPIDGSEDAWELPDWGSAPLSPTPVAGPAPETGPDRCTITGTGGRDVLRGTRGRDVICGLGGRDVLSGGTGDDILKGGAGNDVLSGSSGSDELFGEGGRDVLSTRDRVRGNDDLDGGKGRDACRADRGDDSTSCP